MPQTGILYLTSSISFLGAERVLTELANEIDHGRFRVHIGLMVGHTDLSGIFRKEITRPDVSIVKFEKASRFSFRIAKEIASYIDRNEIDIVHSQGYKPDVHVLFASKISRRKCILVSACHTWKLRTSKEKLYRWVNLAALKFFDLIVAISPDVRNELIAAGIQADRITIIDNGISLGSAECGDARGEARSRLGLSDGDSVIGCIASLTIEKAHKDLIRAFADLAKSRPEMKLVLVGDGNELENLKNMASELSMSDRIVFAGRRNDARLLYPAFDIFALVSYAEGLPMAMLEAMASKVPVVASHVGAIPDVIEDGKNGLLVQPANIGSITKAVHRFIENSDMRLNLGRAGYETIVEKYSSKRMTGDYERLYLSAMRRK